jgi:hypothetical protein
MSPAELRVAMDGCHPGVYETEVGKKPSAKSEVS